MLVERNRNKKRKLYHFEQFREEFTYTNFVRGTLTDNGIEYRGYAYTLENPNMELLINVATKYGNTKIISAQYKWAPSQKYVCLFIAD